MSQNPADSVDLTAVLSNQGAILDQHGDALSRLNSRFTDLSNQLSDFTASFNTRPVNPGGFSPNGEGNYNPPGFREPAVPIPHTYSGEPGDCRSFLMQCMIVFDLQPLSYPSDRSRIAFVVNLLTGRALQWASSIWNAQSEFLVSFERFSTEMRRAFDHPTRRAEASRRLQALHQGARAVSDYAIDFRTLASETGWRDDLALQSSFYQGLSDPVKDQLAAREEPEDLDDLIQTAIRLDDRQRERRWERSTRPTPSTSNIRATTIPPRTFPSVGAVPPVVVPRSTDSEPMQLGRTHLSAEERSRRLQEGACLYCGRPGHVIASCPARPVKDLTRQL